MNIMRDAASTASKRCRVIGTGLAALLVLPALAWSASSDFDGDGKSDLLFQNTGTQQVSIWLMNGAAVGGSGSPGAPSADWVIKGVGDFDGNGKADVLWQNSTSGQVIIWLMNGTTVATSGSPGTPGTDWSVKGVADFDGDGKADILWQNSTSGQVVIWFMNGTTITSAASPSGPITGWSVVAVGDFDGNGKADIAWQNDADNSVVIWLMNGATIIGSGSLGAPDPQWSVQGVGDFNGDQKADIVWQNATSGQVSIWLMNGAAIASSTSPAAPTSDWTLAGVGDYNGDGNADIAWRNADGTVAIWLMTAGAISGSGVPGIPNVAWQIAALSPYGCPDAFQCLLMSTSNTIRANGSFGPGNAAPSATPGGPLQPVTWSVAAAHVAKNYAVQCNAAHNANRGPFGENINFGGANAFTGADTANGWASEAVNYTYATNTCAAGQTCGHYTQVVWRTSTAVGCGLAHCTVNNPFGGIFAGMPWDFEVCDYSPPGNFIGQPPY